MNTLVQTHDLDAEASVLSAVLLTPEIVADIQQIVEPEDFYADANRHIARAIWDLDSAARTIDTTTVATALKDSNRLQQIGGVPYLAQIVGSTPAVAHAEEHARIVADKARIRRVQKLCDVIRAEGYGAIENASAWLESVEKRVFEATRRVQVDETMVVLRDSVQAEHDAMKARKEHGTVVGASTGFAHLDRKLGGLEDGGVYVFAGRPSHGKTAIAWQVATHVASLGDAVVFASLEMPREQLTQRALAQASGIELGTIRTGRLADGDWTSMLGAIDELQRLPLVIDDHGSQSIHGVRSSVRRGLRKIHQRFGEKRLGLVVVDYLQIMAAERRHGASRENEVTSLSNGIREMAREFRCPVILLSQLNRDIEKRAEKRPVMSDLRESGAIEQDAYGIVFVYRDDVYREPTQHTGEAELIVAKHRNGSIGMVPLMFAGKCTKFYEKADDVRYDEFDAQFEDGTDRSDEWHP